MRRFSLRQGLLFSLCAALLGASLGASAASIQTRPLTRSVVLAINEFSYPSPNAPILDVSVEVLKKALKGKLIVRYYKLEQIEPALRRGEIDLLLSSAGYFVRERSLGLRNLATIVHPLAPDPNQSEGSAFFVRSDRTDLKSIADLQGKSVAANLETAFAGYQIAMGELVRRGYDYEKFFSRKIFIDVPGDDMRLIIDKVRNGEVDVGIIRSCFLEITNQPKGEFRVIEPRPENTLYCQYSTDLYPNWTLSITSTAPQQIAGIVTSALLDMKPGEAKGLAWDITTDYSAVDRLFKDIKFGPYAYLKEWTLRRFVATYYQYLLIALLIIIALCLHGLFLEKKVQKRTKALAESLAKEKELERKAAMANADMEALLRAGAVSQLSSIFAHEVRQPLGAIMRYIRGLKRLSEDFGEERSRQFRQVLANMDEEAQLIEEILTKVRGYAKRTVRKLEVVDLSETVREVTSNLQTAHHVRHRIRVDVEENALIEADRFELRLVLVNLVRNASDAMSGRPDGIVSVAVRKTPSAVTLSVSDEGPRISDEDFKRLTAPLKSSKASGLGLGLAIVKGIAEAHRAELKFLRLEKGLRVYISFPAAPS